MTPQYLHRLAPPYLASLLIQYSLVRSPRSSGYNQLCGNKTKTKSYRDRALQNATPKLWNKLPKCIRVCNTLTSFKSKLKHYLFVESSICGKLQMHRNILWIIALYYIMYYILFYYKYINN